jgi:hypothetical protein
MGRMSSTHGELRSGYKVLVGKPEGKRPHEGLRHKWEDNIKTNLKEVEWKSVDLIWLAQGRAYWWAFVNMVMNLQVL